MRLIDADKLEAELRKTKFLDENDKVIVCSVIENALREGYEEDVVNKMQNEIDHWRRHCDLLESTIIKLAIRYMEREGV